MFLLALILPDPFRDAKSSRLQFLIVQMARRTLVWIDRSGRPKIPKSIHMWFVVHLIIDDLLSVSGSLCELYPIWVHHRINYTFIAFECPVAWSTGKSRGINMSFSITFMPFTRSAAGPEYDSELILEVGAIWLQLALDCNSISHPSSLLSSFRIDFVTAVTKILVQQLRAPSLSCPEM
jgi:hypothetical protein